MINEASEQGGQFAGNARIAGSARPAASAFQMAVVTS
jgi:hypothetical protein